MTSARDYSNGLNEQLTKAIAELKLEIKELKEKSDRDRTLFAQETQSKRVVEQKLLQALDSLSRVKKQKSMSDEEMKIEYEGIKESMEKLQEKVEKVHELEFTLKEKEEEIAQLKRKCKNFQREISLLQDEINL